MLYFLYDRKNPTRYAHYRRALTPEQERAYVEDIRRHGPEYILLTDPFRSTGPAGTRESFSEYAASVLEWILENYAMSDRLGSVRILRKKP
jgi:hypothetical protein